jgi:hypothetical protein
MAIVVETEVGGEAHRRAARNIPCDHRSYVVGGFGEADAVPLSQATIHFRAQGEVLAAEFAGPGGGGKSQRAAGTQSIPKLPGAIAQILLGNDVFRNVPALEVAGEN